LDYTDPNTTVTATQQALQAGTLGIVGFHESIFIGQGFDVSLSYLLCGICFYCGALRDHGVTVQLRKISSFLQIMKRMLQSTTISSG